MCRWSEGMRGAGGRSARSTTKGARAVALGGGRRAPTGGGAHDGEQLAEAQLGVRQTRPRRRERGDRRQRRGEPRPNKMRESTVGGGDHRLWGGAAMDTTGAPGRVDRVAGGAGHLCRPVVARRRVTAVVTPSERAGGGGQRPTEGPQGHQHGEEEQPRSPWSARCRHPSHDADTSVPGAPGRPPHHGSLARQAASH